MGWIAVCILCAYENKGSDLSILMPIGIESMGRLGVSDIDRRLDLDYISKKFPNLYNYFGVLVSASIYKDEILSRNGSVTRYVISLICEKENRKMIFRKTFMEAEEYLLELFRDEEGK